jgi:hypothetical protein
VSLLKGTLKLGRKLTAARFTETVTIGAFEPGTDPETGDAIETLASTSYAGPAQVVIPSLTVSDHEAPGQPAAEQSPYVKLPPGTVLAEGEDLRVDASAVDASLVGLRAVIDGRAQSGQTTAARYPLREVS